MNAHRIETDTRAASETIGTVLLIALVITGAIIVSATGFSALNSVQNQLDRETTELESSAVDAKLSSLASGGSSTVEITASQETTESVTLLNGTSGGSIHIAINGGVCNVTLPLSSLRLKEPGQTTVYEGGGIFRRTDGSLGAAVASPPALQYDDGTLDITTFNLSGSYDGEQALIQKDEAFSIEQSQEFEQQLLESADECRRPDSVTVTVTSDYHQAWKTHLSRETGVPATNSIVSSSATVTLSGAALPASTNDSLNQVVNLSDSSMATVNRSNGSIVVDKNVSNQYIAVARPLANGVQNSRVKQFETNVAYRRPLDVALVFDESGSMGDNTASGDTKMEKAQDAAKSFVSKLNASNDRVGIAGFDSRGRIIATPNGEFLTNDFGSSGINGSIDDLETGGNTASAEGLNRGNTLLSLKGESDADKVVILLSDGKDTAGDNPSTEAEIAAANGVTIHTIGFGDSDDLNETRLTAIADTTGGSYFYAPTDGDLDQVFTDIFATIAQTDVVVNEPVTLKAGVGAGATFEPSLGSDVDDVETVSGNPNVNDPTAPPFSFSLSPQDGNLVTINATTYDCITYEATDIVQENETGADLVEIRCVDVDESSATEVPPSNTTVYLNGDDASPVLNGSSAWWDGDLRNDTFQQGTPDALINQNDTFTLTSNQAVVVFEFGQNSEGKKRLLMLYEVGLPEETTVAEVVNVNVVTADVEE